MSTPCPRAVSKSESEHTISQFTERQPQCTELGVVMISHKYLFCLFAWQPDVRGAGPDTAGAPGGGGALHPTLHKEHLEEQLSAGGLRRGAPPAGLLRLCSWCPQHNGTVPEQRHSQAATTQAPEQQEICEYDELCCYKKLYSTVTLRHLASGSKTAAVIHWNML